MTADTILPRVVRSLPYAIVAVVLGAVAIIATLPLVLWLISNSEVAFGSPYFYYFVLPPSLFGVITAVLAFIPIRRRRHPWWALIPATFAITGVLLLTIWKPLIGQLQY